MEARRRVEFTGGSHAATTTTDQMDSVYYEAARGPLSCPLKNSLSRVAQLAPDWTPSRTASHPHPAVLACSALCACPFVDPIGFRRLPLPPPIQFRTPRLAAADAAGHVQVRHHPHLLLRGRRGAPRRRLPARLHLPRQGPGRLGAGDAPALARARGRPRRRPAPEPRRRVPPRARQPRALRHELRHRRPRRRLPLPPLAPRLPHRLPRLHARLARPLLPPRRAPRPLRPRRRRRLRPRRARRRHARPAPPHRRHRQHPLLAERRPRPRPPARSAAQGGGQRRRRGRPLVRAGVTAAVALGSECGHSSPCCDPVLDSLFPSIPTAVQVGPSLSHLQ